MNKHLDNPNYEDKPPKPGDPDPLSSQQERALELVVRGLSDAEIARRIKVSRQTINTWRRHDFSFSEALETRRAALREQHIDSLNELITEALGVVHSAMHSQNEGMRLKAATLVLRAYGIQGNQKPDKNADGGMADFVSQLSAAIGNVAGNLGYQDPTRPDKYKQLTD